MRIKTAYSELAIFGNVPAFIEPLHVGRPNIGDRERLLQRINDMLDRRWLSNHGPFVQEFEAEVARRLGVKHCIAMCNGTVALEIAIRALGLTGEVIVPSFTFIATAHALQWQEITPVFCDINERTHTIDPAAVERMITPRTTGIIGVHVWGQPCETEALTRIADKRNLQLLFDASHAFGCSSQAWSIGNFGRAEVFSFHATKFCNTFEGGAITTNDNELAAKIRLMKNFGFSGYDNVIYIGTNGKMSEVCAAMGLTSLESLDSFIQANRANYEAYRRGLAGAPGVRMIEFDASEQCNYQYIIIEIDDAETGISRDLILRILHAENILARRYFYPGCHRMEPYRSYFPHADLLLPNTNAVARRVLVLPTGTTVDEAHISAICGIIRLCISHGRELTSELSKTEVNTTVYVS
jgi:dTDP-4-amino-4,6-dideoxygalactose transaminase